MRVVDYHKDTNELPYQLIKGVGMVAGVFSLVICILLIANNLSLKKTDPIHSPALQHLIEELKSDPQNDALKQEIRELDFIARRAFFTSQRFNRLGIFLLVGGLVVMVIAMKSLEAFKTVPPYPDSTDPKDDLVENQKWARKAVTAVGLVLVGFALMIALPWESTLDIPDEVIEAEAAKAKEGGGSEVAPPAPAVAAAPIATPEQMLANWTSLRGPAANISQATGLLTEWSGEAGEGIRWKTAIPLPGYSSPIYWDGRLYLTGGDEANRKIYCFDAESGELAWEKGTDEIPGTAGGAAEVSEDTGYAAATMATDGARVFASFANGDLVALDLDGNPVWGKNLGLPENTYGYASSLLTHGETLFVQYDQDEAGFVAGYDVATGEERWKTARDFGASWSSPAVYDTGERDELILAAEPTVVSYDPATGSELWRVDCLDHGEVASIPAYGDGIVYVSADAAKLSAIDVKTQEIVWENDDLKPGVSTPLLHEGLLYCGSDDGAFVCYDAKTGEEVWAEFADYGFYASPIFADGKVWMLDRGGIMHILKPGRGLEILAQPELGEESSCTPAMIGDAIYIRGTENLYRIGP